MIGDEMLVREAVGLVTDCWRKIDILRKKKVVAGKRFFFSSFSSLSFIEIYPLLFMGTSKLRPPPSYPAIQLLSSAQIAAPHQFFFCVDCNLSYQLLEPCGMF